MVSLSLFLRVTALVCALPTSYVTAWSNLPRYMPTKRTVMEMRRGRGSLGKEVGGGGGMGGGSSSNSGGMDTSSGINWVPIKVSAKSLPAVDNEVGLIDTNLITMKNAQTNPTGAVSVMKYKDQTYCFAVNCPSCKIPLTKAQAIPANEESDGQPRLVCDFCKATYNLKTGAKLTSDVKAGIMGGIAKSVFGAQQSGPLPVYKLGEKGGKLNIALEQD